MQGPEVIFMRFLMCVATLLVGCGGGATYTYEPAPDVDAGVEDAGPSCSMSRYCDDSYWTCEECVCPGMPCTHVPSQNSPYASSPPVIGICSAELKCSEPCPSPTVGWGCGEGDAGS